MRDPVVRPSRRRSWRARLRSAARHWSALRSPPPTGTTCRPASAGARTAPSRACASPFACRLVEHRCHRDALTERVVDVDRVDPRALERGDVPGMDAGTAPSSGTLCRPVMTSRATTIPSSRPSSRDDAWDRGLIDRSERFFSRTAGTCSQPPSAAVDHPSCADLDEHREADQDRPGLRARRRALCRLRHRLPAAALGLEPARPGVPRARRRRPERVASGSRSGSWSEASRTRSTRG